MEGKFSTVIYILQCELAKANHLVSYPQTQYENPALPKLEVLIAISEENQNRVLEIDEAISILKREQEKAPQK